MAAPVEACLLSQLLRKVDEILKRPEDFLTPRKNLANDLKKFTKKLYDIVKDYETQRESRSERKWIDKSEALPELIIDNFDDEQIWQELELQNDELDSRALKGVSQLLAAKDRDDIELLPASRIDVGDDDSDNADESEVEEDNCDENEDEDNGDENEGEDNDKEMEEKGNDEDGDESDIEGAGYFDNDDAMSDTSIELEKALDQKIAIDQNEGIQSESDGSEENNDADDNDEDEDKDLNFLDVADKSNNGESSVNNKFQRSTIVDDQFFRLAELEEFLDAEDRKESQNFEKSAGVESDEDEVDLELFQDVRDEYGGGESDDETSEGAKKSARFLRFKDFFYPPRAARDFSEEDNSNREVTLDPLWINRNKRNETESTTKRKHLCEDNKEDRMGSDNDVETDVNAADGQSEDKSSFEKRQEKLNRRIKQLEENNLSEKPWQMMGEASSAIRPENSLLQEHLNFDHMTRQAPVITEETTTRLEDVIRQRIKDQIWDDVERKVKPTEEPFEYKKKIVLDQEKSKKSLAEVYEQEYVKQQETETENEKDEPKEHKEIKKSMAILFAKLDALSNFHFVPKPPRPELKIVSNLPAITVEEVAPVSVSDATLLAPEEIKSRPKGVEIGKSERTVTDRKRERREKKAKQRVRQKQRDAKQKLVDKLNPGLGNKYSKMAALKKLTADDNVTVIGQGDKKSRNSLASSKNFFSQLQDEVASSIKTKKVGKKTFDKKNPKLSGAMFKL